MGYIRIFLREEHELKEELLKHPEKLKYYAKYETFIGSSDSVKFLENEIKTKLGFQ